VGYGASAQDAPISKGGVDRRVHGRRREILIAQDLERVYDQQIIGNSSPKVACAHHGVGNQFTEGNSFGTRPPLTPGIRVTYAYITLNYLVLRNEVQPRR
jgi:hypothetical protein